MVRFSDIIKIKDKKRIKARPEEGTDIHRDKFRLSDSQAFKIDKKKPDPFDNPPRINADLEIVSYYEKFIERALDIREKVKSDKGISPSPVLSDLHHIIEKDLHKELQDIQNLNMKIDVMLY